MCAKCVTLLDPFLSCDTHEAGTTIALLPPLRSCIVYCTYDNQPENYTKSTNKD